MSSINQLYQSVTAAIVAELEQGVAPWVKPWTTSPRNGGYLPHNAVTGRAYRGINIPILWGRAAQRGFPTHAWLTYKQAQEKGAHVRKGEKATEVVFTKKLRVKDRETEEEKQISMLKSFWVFNREQIEDLPDPSTDGLPEPTPDQKSAKVDSFVTATHADIQHGGNEAAFMPELDYIVMPPFGAFKTTEGYYATGLHELGHWSGHATRLDRNLTGRFGTRSYAAEELVAELTSAFLCAHLGITGELRHAGYLSKWAELLKNDDRAIFTAAAKAQQAADFLRGFSEETTDGAE
jgi:antirestriction protein ArdC